MGDCLCGRVIFTFSLCLKSSVQMQSLSLSAVNLSFCCCCCFLGSAVEKSNDSGYFYAVKYFALISSLPSVLNTVCCMQCHL